MKIFFIECFRLSIEGNRLDRFVNNVDSIIKPFSKLNLAVGGVVGDDQEVSWNFTSDTTGEITFNTNEKINYISIVSNLFTGNNMSGPGTSYWFLDSIKSINSGNSRTYNISLDEFATFGKDFLNSFKNKNIEIKRQHEDRYKVSKSNGVVTLDINKDNVSLFQSDFKIGETLKQNKTYQKAKQTSNDGQTIHAYFVDGKIAGVIDNRVSTDNGVWWKYAIIELSGEPNTIRYGNATGTGGSVDEIESMQNFVSNDSDRGVGVDAFKMIIPVGRQDGKNSEGELNINSIQEIDRIPQGKITSMFLSPVFLNPKVTNNNLFLLPIGKESDISKKTLAEVLTQTEANQKDTSSIPIIYGFSFPELDDDKQIELPNWDGKLIQTFAGSKTEALEFLKKESNEIGLYNPNISPIELLYKGDSDLKIRIDLANYLKEPKVVFRAQPDGQGSLFDLNISDYHFATLDSKTQLNVISESGTNYLNNNRAQIDANKEGFRLQAKLQKNQISVQQSQQYGGGIVGGALSLINPANWGSSIIRSGQNEIIDATAENNIAKINGAISDATAQSPSIREGSGNGWKLASTYEELGIFTYMFVQPNEVLLSRIYNHYNKFGYKAEKWIEIPDIDSWWETRTKFNFLQIEDIKDYYNGELNIDDSIVQLFQKALKAGVRIWTQAKIEYDNSNIEKSINEI